MAELNVFEQYLLILIITVFHYIKDILCEQVKKILFGQEMQAGEEFAKIVMQEDKDRDQAKAQAQTDQQQHQQQQHSPRRARPARFRTLPSHYYLKIAVTNARKKRTVTW
ncbi:hypothetical protein GGS26DRAFT_585870 [Hypomontagnella submonticulosa]|nr:hypothetical protein GGS26DRAFT_585870 [Hypomontagnella submonticulosa]